MDFPHNAVLLLVPHMIKAVVLTCVQLAIVFLTVLNSTGRPTLRLVLTEAQNHGQGQWTIWVSQEAIGWPGGKSETSELLCPLCRGQVKGWTVVEPARWYLDAKKRNSHAG
ncbi:UNVERIFIED_CONTAM: hypothetical protein Sangu_1955700 [Sesamum angustifolium]|uniref:Secreted protein n=1 Tax=Sesamum angustifolium TaxID=2727405 RepID=A0AAW2LY17_9LAMI